MARLAPYMKIPGAACGMVNVELPAEETVMDAGPGGIPTGISKLICPALTYQRGATTPSTVTITPPSERGKGTLLAPMVVLARFVPNTVAREPGDGGPVK